MVLVVFYFDFLVKCWQEISALPTRKASYFVDVKFLICNGIINRFVLKFLYVMANIIFFSQSKIKWLYQIILNSYIDQFHLNFQLNKTHDYKEQASHRIFKVFIIFVKVGILHIYDIHKHGRLTNWHYANRTFMVHSRFSNKCTVFLSKHLMIFDIK